MKCHKLKAIASPGLFGISDLPVSLPIPGTQWYKSLEAKIVSRRVRRKEHSEWRELNEVCFLWADLDQPGARKTPVGRDSMSRPSHFFFSAFLLSSLELSDAKVYQP